MKQYSGVVIGLVKEIDPTLGRIKVNFPWMTPPQRSHWAPIASLMGGKKRGAFFMPEIDDEVLLAFEQGNFDHPYVVGFLWNGADPSPETDHKNRVITTPGGHTLRFEDHDGEKRTILRSSSGLEVLLDDKDQLIQLRGGGRSLMLKDGKVQIT
jgi:uncharacterized protein involved in type VI secretion and phage assembly